MPPQPGPFIHTPRTILRQLSLEDAEDFYALNLDEEVLRYTGDKPFENVQAARDFLLHYDQYQKYGVGRLAVIEKTSDKFMGWCGFKYQPHKNEYDIGFRFFKTFWNQGFAGETAKACLDYGFEELSLTRIVGRTMKENQASIKVLQKIGMHFKEPIDFNGQEGVLYERTKEQG
jgi:ribosomal-protein-alanine N-acetyltransferase